MPRTQDPTRPQRRSKRRTREQKFLEQVHLNAAGIDSGSGSHWVAVPTDRDEQPVREFRSFTHALIDLADGLTACDIDTVAMESTGVYWIPLYAMLEARGFTVLLVNARHVKNVPGRKSDVSDCQWIQRLHTFGLLRGSFRPTAEITAIRTLLRHRDTLVEALLRNWLATQQDRYWRRRVQSRVMSRVCGGRGGCVCAGARRTRPRMSARRACCM